MLDKVPEVNTVKQVSWQDNIFSVIALLSSPLTFTLKVICHNVPVDYLPKVHVYENQRPIRNT